MKVPALNFILADNQPAVAKVLDEFGAARCLGRSGNLNREEIASAILHLMHDKEARQRMSKRGEVLVDGRGVDRVSKVMLRGASEKALRLRLASQEDTLLLWQWANEAVTRRNSFVSEPISWVVHEAWYREKIVSRDTRFWILECQHVPVGQIRYDRADAYTARISFSIAPWYRGRGLGTQLLRLTADLAGKELGVHAVEGITFVENRASNHTFVRAGFEVIEEKSIGGHACFIFRRFCLPMHSREPDGAVR